jgi:hypothetical protein
MLIFRSLKNKIEDEIIGKIIHLTFNHIYIKG